MSQFAAFLHSGAVELLAVYAVGCIALRCRAQRRREAMDPPALGELHFHDGDVVLFRADSADAAIDRLIAGRWL